MKHFFSFIIATLLTMSCLLADEKRTYTIVELPRPNSGTFSFTQAEARKNEILENSATAMLSSWKNPYMGFSIHIHKDDSITIYNHWLEAFTEDRIPPRSKATIKQIKKLADELPLWGNPAGILITSDRPVKNSKNLRKLLDAVFVPSIQIFYAKQNQPSEQDSAHQSTPRSESKSE